MMEYEHVTHTFESVFNKDSSSEVAIDKSSKYSVELGKTMCSMECN